MYHPFWDSLLVEEWGWLWKEAVINPKELMSKSRISGTITGLLRCFWASVHM